MIQHGHRKLTVAEEMELREALRPIHEWCKKHDKRIDARGYFSICHQNGQWEVNNSFDKGQEYFSISNIRDSELERGY